MTICSSPKASAAAVPCLRTVFASLCLWCSLLFALSGCGSGGGDGGGGARLAVEASDAWTLCATENKTCVFSGTHQVKYGTETQYVIKSFTGGTPCDNGVFGDPAPGAAKSCWYDAGATSAVENSWVACGYENSFCSFDGTRVVKYGTVTQYVTKTFSDGVGCNNGVFGDPAPGAAKGCWYANTATEPATPTPSAGSPTRAVLSCNKPGTSVAAGGAGDAIEADFAGGDGTRMAAAGAAFQLRITTRTGADVVVNWQIADTWGTVRAQGSFPAAAGARTTTLDCMSALAGYFSISASLGSAPSGLRARGTRPDGIATFGVLPDLAPVLPAATFARQDLRRFGGQGAAYLLPGQACCTGDGYRPLYTTLGLSWANDNRNWYKMEPNGPNTFSAEADQLAPFFKPGDLMRLIQLDGIPAWASPTGAATHSYAPKSLADYQNYMGRVGQESDRIRKQYFPAQAANYYQVTWEPDYAGGLPWLDTDANLVAMYRATWQGIHGTDPSAVVMGITNAMVRENSKWLNRLVPQGLAPYLDGVSVHGYYDIGTSPSHPPERLVGDSDAAAAANALPASMRELRHAVASQLKRGARLFVTETGISYDIGTSYGPAYPTPNVLYGHGAVVARTHLILLGEGADVTFVFYASDTPEAGGQAGYGLFFDLENAHGGYGPAQISPKPAAMAVAAMTRLIDGTNTLGPLTDLPAGAYGYAFQRLGGGKVVTALWAHSNASWNAAAGFSTTFGIPYSLQVDAPGTSGQVSVLDMMGNPISVPYTNGSVNLQLTGTPIYVVSANAAVIQSRTTAPEGYVPQ